MLARDSDRVQILRLIKNALNVRAKEKGEDLTEAEVIAVLQKEAKLRQEAIEQYKAGGRDDLVASEQVELNLIQNYLPAQMSEDELRGIVRQIIVSTGANSQAQMGAVIAAARQQVGGASDGATIARVVKTELEAAV